jgi:predicted anti-sigma-YlaC factor YlaD
MRCAKCQELWQQRLDDPSGDADAALDQHLHDCPECVPHAEGMRRVTEAFWRLPRPPRARPDLAAVIAKAVLADRAARRRVRLRWALSAALAASVLIAVALRFLPGNQPPPMLNQAMLQMSRELPPQPEQQVAAVGPVDDSSAQATRVLATMLDRARKETDNQVAMLRPMVAPTIFDTPPPAVEPVDRPLNEAGQGVVQGLEPVSGSARRAVGLFLRDLSPAGMDENKGL